MRSSPVWVVLGLVLVLGACATASSGGDGAERRSPETTPEGRPIPEHCKAPRGAQPLRWARYDGSVCLPVSTRSMVVRSEDELAAKLGCPPEAEPEAEAPPGDSPEAKPESPPTPSGIDWSIHELYAGQSWFQGGTGSVVRAMDTAEGRVIQYYDPIYCGGAAPEEGVVTWAVLLPRREAGEVTVIGCEPQQCDWGDGGPPP